jgi:hypothetical protein
MVFGENTGSMVYEILWGQSTLSGFCPRFVQVQKFSARGQNTFIRCDETKREMGGRFCDMTVIINIDKLPKM